MVLLTILFCSQNLDPDNLDKYYLNTGHWSMYCCCFKTAVTDFDYVSILKFNNGHVFQTSFIFN